MAPFQYYAPVGDRYRLKTREDVDKSREELFQLLDKELPEKQETNPVKSSLEDWKQFERPDTSTFTECKLTQEEWNVVSRYKRTEHFEMELKVPHRRIVVFSVDGFAVGICTRSQELYYGMTV